MGGGGEREMYKKEKEREREREKGREGGREGGREREIRKQSFLVSQAAHIFAIFKSQCPEIFARSRV